MQIQNWKYKWNENGSKYFNKQERIVFPWKCVIISSLNHILWPLKFKYYSARIQRCELQWATVRMLYTYMFRCTFDICWFSWFYRWLHCHLLLGTETAKQFASIPFIVYFSFTHSTTLLFLLFFVEITRRKSIYLHIRFLSANILKTPIH